MAAAKKVDYAQIESGWRAGFLSPQQLAENYTKATGINVSRAAIIKHFDKQGIKRDLKAKIAAKAEAMVAASKVTGKVSVATLAKEKEIVDANALDVATVQLAHRKDIARSRALGMKLLAEIEAQTDEPELFRNLGEIMASEDNAALTKMYDRVINLPARVDSMKKLADTLKVLIGLEREALNIGGGEQSAGDALDSFLTALDGRTASLIPG
jgi:hypothetical protein